MSVHVRHDEFEVRRDGFFRFRGEFGKVLEQAVFVLRRERMSISIQPSSVRDASQMSMMPVFTRLAITARPE